MTRRVSHSRVTGVPLVGGAAWLPSRQNPGIDLGIVGTDPRMVEAVSRVREVSDSNVTAVLLEGESGTGKDLIARAIHAAGPRRDRPFMELDCAAIPRGSLESELMGRERGTPTSAKSRKLGLIEIADGGTVLLDEITELEPELQSKLLSFLETGRFKRVRGEDEICVDTRVIVSTGCDLEQALKRHRLRGDLYCKLKMVAISLPPLRERRGDVPLLMDHFIKKSNAEYSRAVTSISDRARECLCGYAWPGNVRELKNAIARAIVLSEGTQLDHRHLPAEVRCGARARREDVPLQLTSDGIDLDELERGLICQSLELVNGNQVRAARLLGLGRDAFRYRMKKHGLFGEMSDRSPQTLGAPHAEGLTEALGGGDVVVRAAPSEIVRGSHGRSIAPGDIRRRRTV